MRISNVESLYKVTDVSSIKISSKAGKTWEGLAYQDAIRIIEAGK